MFKEFSCGAIVYKMQNAEPVFLLVNSKRDRLWGFPKGHVEKGETELGTATREIFEETGISRIKFIDGFRQEDVYVINNLLGDLEGCRVKKHSVYFLALALEDALDFDKNEISKFGWFDLKQALDLLYFVNQRKFVNIAYDLIKGGGVDE
ncbi:MAG: NUDIX domain-containing protein [Endomicrobium sp.]|jgi:8-oxo-dGTP pyrophosphatase MutT (NUDIX family)|nr:NUDIX domain-containing protein [Endomicrobium sp.]